MISSKCIKAYRSAYPQDGCAFAEPSSLVLIVNKDGNSFISPFSETEEELMNRLEKSLKDGINYFYIEWEKYSPQSNVLY